MEEHEGVCPECKRITELEFDRNAGYNVCSDCSLLLEILAMDDFQWGSFSNEDNSDNNVRAGHSASPLPSRDNVSEPIKVQQRRGLNPESHLIMAFGAIAIMADKLGIDDTIKARANELYKKQFELNLNRNRQYDAVYAACIYIACREQDSHQHRTVKEIRVVANGASRKGIARVADIVAKLAGVDIGIVHAGDFLQRFCSHLGMSNQAIGLAQEALAQAEKFDIRRNPASKTAAVIYLISQVSGERKSLKEISKVTGVTQGTIKMAYKDLYPYASRIIPTSFADGNDIWNKFCRL